MPAVPKPQTRRVVIAASVGGGDPHGEDRIHFWVIDSRGQTTLYEVDYHRYPNHVGTWCYAKVFASERPCTCPERLNHERRRAAALS